RKNLASGPAHRARNSHACARNRKAGPNRFCKVEPELRARFPGRPGFLPHGEPRSNGSERRNRPNHERFLGAVARFAFTKIGRKTQVTKKIAISCSTAFGIPL